MDERLHLALLILSSVGSLALLGFAAIVAKELLFLRRLSHRTLNW